MQKKYFFFDIDGTLTNGNILDNRIPDSAKEAIKELKQKGHEVGIATGRPYVAAKEFAKEAGIEHIVCNGGYTCFLDGKFIRNKGMDLQDCHHIITQCLEKEIPFLVATGDDFVFYTKDDAFLSAIQGDECHAKIVIDPTIDFYQLPSIFRMMIAIDTGCEDKITEYGNLVPSRYHEHHVIIEPDDKYDGILYMLHTLRGKEEDVVVFGDGLNDVTMFQHAPMSIAMGNGVEVLKQMASYVTKRSDEDGLAYALRHFGWIE